MSRTRRQVTATLVYRGGPECWWQIRSSFGTYNVPGWLCVEDAMKLVLNELEEG